LAEEEIFLLIPESVVPFMLLATKEFSLGARVHVQALEITADILVFLLSLAPQPSLGLGLLHKIRLNFLESSQFSFLQGMVVSPTPNLHPGGPGLCIYIPQMQGGYPF
jgi:hypothetical protein